MAPAPVQSAAQCQVEWNNMVETLEWADVYCSLPASQHTNLLCDSAIKVYDAYRQIYEDCMVRDDQMPY